MSSLTTKLKRIVVQNPQLTAQTHSVLLHHLGNGVLARVTNMVTTTTYDM